eukprot:511198-Karenia_brevis.AAC.1
MHGECTSHYHLALASLANTRTEREQARIKNGTFITPVHKFSGRGNFKWNAHVKALSQAMQVNHGVDVTTWPSNHNNFNHDHDTYFTCPAGHQRLATLPLFSVLRPSKAVWCPSCHHSWGGTRWMCP